MPTAGAITVKDDALLIEHAGSVTLLLSAATSFNGYHRSPGRQGKDPAPIAAGSLAAAAAKPYEDLLHAHVADHQRLFRRVALRPGAHRPRGTEAAHGPESPPVRRP